MKDATEYCDYFNNYKREETYVDDLMLEYVKRICKFLKNKGLDVMYKREKWFCYNSDDFKVASEEIIDKCDEIIKKGFYFKILSFFLTIFFNLIYLS